MDDELRRLVATSAAAFVEAGVQVFACTHSEVLTDLMIGRCPPGLAARIRL